MTILMMVKGNRFTVVRTRYTKYKYSFLFRVVHVIIFSICIIESEGKLYKPNCTIILKYALLLICLSAIKQTQPLNSSNQEFFDTI